MEVLAVLVIAYLAWAYWNDRHEPPVILRSSEGPDYVPPRVRKPRSPRVRPTIDLASLAESGRWPAGVARALERIREGTAHGLGSQPTEVTAWTKTLMGDAYEVQQFLERLLEQNDGQSDAFDMALGEALDCAEEIVLTAVAGLDGDADWTAAREGLLARLTEFLRAWDRFEIAMESEVTR